MGNEVSRPGSATRSRVAVKYTLLQIPELAVLVLILVVVGQWVDFPSWLFWVSIAVWVAKDAMMFPFVWRAYAGDRAGVADSLVGARGFTRERLAPSGYVEVQGVLWRAEAWDGRRAIEQGQEIRVQAVRGLLLVVRPYGEDE